MWVSNYTYGGGGQSHPGVAGLFRGDFGHLIKPIKVASKCDGNIIFELVGLENIQIDTKTMCLRHIQVNI